MSILDDRPDFSPVSGDDISPTEAEVLSKVLQALRQIKHGYIQVTIQDSRVVQIDRTEKQRLTTR